MNRKSKIKKWFFVIHVYKSSKKIMFRQLSEHVFGFRLCRINQRTRWAKNIPASLGKQFFLIEKLRKFWKKISKSDFKAVFGHQTHLIWPNWYTRIKIQAFLNKINQKIKNFDPKKYKFWPNEKNTIFRCRSYSNLGVSHRANFRSRKDH